MIEHAIWEALSRESERLHLSRWKAHGLVRMIAQRFDRAQAAQGPREAGRIEYYCRICGTYDRHYGTLLWHVEERHSDEKALGSLIGAIGRSNACAPAPGVVSAAIAWLHEVYKREFASDESGN
jgi:hypothetical protein